MKNKFNYILFGILFVFLFMNNVFAEDALNFEVYVDNNNIEVVNGTVGTVKVGIKSEKYINSCTFKIVSDSGLEIQGYNELNGFAVTPGEQKVNVMDSGTTGDAPVDGINVMQINYKVNSSGKITIKTEECISFDDEKTGTYKDVVVNFVVKEITEDYTLKDVKINGGTVFNFSPSGNNYSVTLEKPEFSLSYETTNPDYQDDVVVKFNDVVVNDLNNMIWSDPYHQTNALLEIIVNEKKTYKFSVNYAVKDLDNTLKFLKINGVEIDLVSDKTNYSIKVKNDVTNLLVEAVLNDSTNFKIEEPFIDGKLNHGCSKNSCPFQIEIVPVSDKIGGSSLSYIIEVIKEGGGTPSSNSVSKPSSSKTVTGDVDKNPQTGDISMFLMALILISSLIGSVLLYQKNMEGYK